MKSNFTASLFLLPLFAGMAYGQTTPPPPVDTTQGNVFRLGEVVVTSDVDKAMNSKINDLQLQEFAKIDVSGALNLLPGITLSTIGNRNEAMIHVRGFELRQVPVLIDGIPVYVPYNGYVDLGRFTTFDLAEINVSKGYTSVLYGPNSMGGAINLVSRRPAKAFEMEAIGGWLSGGYRGNINVGSNLGEFYFQAGVSRLSRDYFPLSSNFSPVPNENADRNRRGNSYNYDDKISLKVGYTPNEKSEYALSYIYQTGEKGSPIYAGNDEENPRFSNPRYWQWPYWDKQSLYFISNNVIDETQYIKTRLYYDEFKNLLTSYDDATFTTITRPYAFESYYNDYTYGGILEYGKSLWQDRNIIKATLQYKQDVHRENDEAEPVATMSDNTWTIGFENVFRIMPNFDLLTGVSYNRRSSIEAQDYNSDTGIMTDFDGNSNNAFNIQGGLVYRYSDDHIFNVSVARKTRFATTQNRYSYSMGNAIPNPDLLAEYAINYELGYNGIVFGTLKTHGALFYSDINNTMLTVNNVYEDPNTGDWLNQLQNTGASNFRGAEVGLEYPIAKSLNTGVNYTYIRMKNVTNPNVYFTDVPEHKVFGFVQYRFSDFFSLQANAEHNSERYSSSYGTTTGAFTLFNARAAVKIGLGVSADVAINNIMDKNYALAEGFPAAGRNFQVNLIFRH